jgi:DNA-binding transcriptional ArsR family regulator
MKSMMVIREPEAFQLLADETRRKILYLLRVKEMTVNEIAEQLGITSQAIYHHIKKLVKGNMVEVVREERVGHLIESYYRATAEDFLLTHGKMSPQSLHDRKLAEEQITAVLNALNKLGFKLEFDEDNISQLVDLRAQLVESCVECKQKYEDKIWNMDDLNFLTKMMASDFAGTLLMSDEEFARKMETGKKCRALLRSLVKR